MAKVQLFLEHTIDIPIILHWHKYCVPLYTIHNPMKPILTLLVLLLCATTQAQEKATTDTQALTQRYWAIKWHMTQLTNPINFSAQIGVERRFGKYAVELQGGYTLPAKHHTGPNKENTNYTEGYSLRAEGRRYIHTGKKHPNLHLFAGLQGFYTYYTAPELHYTDNYAEYKEMIEVQTFGASPVMGFQDRIGKHFLIEGYAGIGYKRKVQTGVPYISGGTFQNFISINEDSYSTVAIPLSFSIGYYF